MEGRKQFTFYRSFYEALTRIKNKEDRADVFDAICKFALYGEEPDLDALCESGSIAFMLIQPVLETAAKKAKNGKKGGETKQVESTEEENGSKRQAKRKQSGSKAEANAKQSGSEKEGEKEGEKEKEKEVEIENECCYYPPNPLTDPALGEVFRAYMDRINPFASETVRTELQHFTKALGKDVVLWAFDAALDAKKANWQYIRAILRDKERRGVKCLSDLQTCEKTRESRAPERQKTFSEIIAEREGTG